MSSVLDFKRTPVPWHIYCIRTGGWVDLISDKRPYFYVAVEEGMERHVLDTVTWVAEREQSKRLQLLRKLVEKGYLWEQDYAKVKEKPVAVEEADYRVWVYDELLGRYTVARHRTVYRVKVWIPQVVRETVKQVRSDPHVADYASFMLYNILYAARVMFDTPWAKPLDIIPIYYDLDTDILEKLRKVRYLVYDIEYIPEKKTYIISLLEAELGSVSKPAEELDRMREHVQTFVIDKKTKDKVIDQLRDIFAKAEVLVGFNNVGFDDRELRKLGVTEESDVYAELAQELRKRQRAREYDRILSGLKILERPDQNLKVVIDLAVFLRAHAQAAGIGTAAFSLADVLISLKEKLGIPLDMIEIKLRGARMLRNIEEAKRYNVNDVLATWVLAETFLPYIFGVAGLIQVPPSVVYRVRPGQLFEYAFVHWLEIHGELIEAREVIRRPVEEKVLRGIKVLTFDEILKFWTLYRDKIEKAVDEGPQALAKTLREVADEILKKILKPSAQKEKRGGKKLQKLFVGKILHMDVEMMYPTKILREQIDPCTLVLGRGEKIDKYLEAPEDAKFDSVRLPAPFYTFVKRLYMARAWVKQKQKEAAKRGDKIAEAKFKLLSDLIKPIINSAYGAMSKRSGATHGGHAVVAGKIFQATIRDLVMLMLYALALGVKYRKMLGITGSAEDVLPLYGDTDSLFIKLPDYIDPDKFAEELNKFAQEVLGYTLSKEGVYDMMFIYAKKNYMILGTDEKGSRFVKVKGQLIARLKHITSPLVRAWVLDALKEQKVELLVQRVLGCDDPLLLVPSLAKKFADIIALDVEAQKRAQREKVREQTATASPSGSAEPPSLRRKVKIVLFERDEKGKIVSRRVSYLKAPYPAGVNLARFAALALNYGVRADGSTYVIDLERRSLEDIADLRALLIVDRHGKLSGRTCLVLVTNPEKLKDRDREWECYLVTLPRATAGVKVVKSGDREEKMPAAPTRYVLKMLKPWATKIKSREAAVKAYEKVVIPTYYAHHFDKYRDVVAKSRQLTTIVSAIEVDLHILREVTDIREIQYYVLKTLDAFFKWSELRKVFQDYEVLEQAIAKLSKELAEAGIGKIRFGDLFAKPTS